MIALLQKTRLLASVLRRRLESGHAPDVSRAVDDLNAFLKGKRLGAPLAALRPARSGEIIGGPDGADIERTLLEAQADLELLYTALIALAARTVDTYDIFSVRVDRLGLTAAALRQEAQTLLAQQSAASANGIADHFQTLDRIDLTQTTAQIDLAAGTATLPVNSMASVRYDGSRTKVARTLVPAGSLAPGPPFGVVFSNYRTDAWYLSIPVGQEFVAEVNVTGADFERGGTEEVLLNAVRIDPTGPLHVALDWSPDGLNWHPLDPVTAQTIRAPFVFHFAPVQVGFLRFRLRHSEEISTANAGQTRAIGIKNVELYRRGYASSASLYSTALEFHDPVHTAVIALDADRPAGTRIDPFVSQNAGGPWLPVTKDPIAFDALTWTEKDVDPATIAEETPGLLATMWEFPIESGSVPVPELGTLFAGRDQVALSAFAFDWAQLGDAAHVPIASDWANPYGAVRTATFDRLGDLATLGGSDFATNQSPVAVDQLGAINALVVALLQADGNWILQRGQNYRLRAYVWCAAPITLERQQIGIVNPGGAGVVIAPLAFYVNGTKLYQQETAVASVDQLSGMAYTTTVPLAQGVNALELYLQIPAGLAPGVSGVAASSIYLYFQPNLFAPNREIDFGIQSLYAYGVPWKQVSEFDARYNTPPGVTAVWAWKYEPLFAGSTERTITSVLLPADPTNSRLAATKHASYQTIDGQNATDPVRLTLRYPVERSRPDLEGGGRRLYFRADFSMAEGASAPPILRGYQILSS